MSTPSRHPRVALYGHDTCGLGHLRRNLALAAALRAGAARPDVLLITGSPAAQRFARPEGVEIVVLPSVRKDADGRYSAGALDVPLDVVVGLRAATATAAAWANRLEEPMTNVSNVYFGLSRASISLRGRVSSGWRGGRGCASPAPYGVS